MKGEALNKNNGWGWGEWVERGGGRGGGEGGPNTLNTEAVRLAPGQILHRTSRKIQFNQLICDQSLQRYKRRKAGNSPASSCWMDAG